MNFLCKLEDVFVQIIRLVLVIFALVVLVALGLMLWGKATSSSHSSNSETTTTRVWGEFQPDMKFVLEETGRDVDVSANSKSLQDSLTDPQLRTAFQKIDTLMRDFVAQQPEQHARVERDNEARGFAPKHPLLVGDAVPSAAQAAAAIKDYDARMERLRSGETEEEAAGSARTVVVSAVAASATDAAVEAVDAAEEAACCGSELMYWTDPVDVVAEVHSRAQQTASEYDADAYAAYVRGLPAALELVLNDKNLAPRLHEMPVSRLVSMVLVNYSMGFSRAVNGDTDNSMADSWTDNFFSSIELTLWSVIFSFLVLVVLVLMLIRMERHLRLMSQQGQRHEH